MENPNPSTKKKKVVKTNTETQRKREIYTAIVNFVEALWDGGFGNAKKATPLTLYHYLIQNVKITDQEKIDNIVKGFELFCSLYEREIVEDKLDNFLENFIPYGPGTGSGKVKIEIQKFIYKTRNDPDTRQSIRRHLLTISTLIKPDQSKIEQLEKKPLNELNLDPDTPEGRFLTNVMTKAKANMQNIDTSNPMQAVMGIAQSGVLTDMIDGLKNGVGSGEMSFPKLFQAMQGAISAVMPNMTEEDQKVEEVEDKK